MTNDTLILKVKFNGIWKIKLLERTIKCVLWFVNLNIFDKRSNRKDELVLNFKIDVE